MSSDDTFLTAATSPPHLKGATSLHSTLGGPALDFELPNGDGAAAVVPDPTPSIEELERVQQELLAADAARRDARSRAALQEALANHKNSDHERQSLVAYLDELRGRDDEAGAVRAPPASSGARNSTQQPILTPTARRRPSAAPASPPPSSSSPTRAAPTAAAPTTASSGRRRRRRRASRSCSPS